MAYQDDHPNPIQLQQKKPRRQKVSGVLGVHTSESVMDTVGPDTGAENVARFISQRSGYGSYHRLADYDSIVNNVEFWNEAFHIAVAQMNWHSIGLSFACRTTDWMKMSAQRRKGFLMNGALNAVHAADYVRTTAGIIVPLRWLTKEQAIARVPGYVRHGTVDSARRSDPGSMQPGPAHFPHVEFFDYISDLSKGAGPLPPTRPPEDNMALSADDKAWLNTKFANTDRGIILNAAALAELKGISQRDYQAQLVAIHEAREQAAAAGKSYAEFEAEMEKLARQ